MMPVPRIHRTRFALSVLAIVLLSSCYSWRRYCLHSYEAVPRQELKASKTVRRAYVVLLDTDTFEGPFVGFGGAPSRLVCAYEKILQSRDAIPVFKQLLAEATLAGQVYALCGLYVTDRNLYEQKVLDYLKSAEQVSVQYGCEGRLEPVATFVREAPAWLD